MLALARNWGLPPVGMWGMPRRTLYFMYKCDREVAGPSLRAGADRDRERPRPTALGAPKACPVAPHSAPPDAVDGVTCVVPPIAYWGTPLTRP